MTARTVNAKMTIPIVPTAKHVRMGCVFVRPMVNVVVERFVKVARVFKWNVKGMEIATVRRFVKTTPVFVLKLGNPEHVK